MGQQTGRAGVYLQGTPAFPAGETVRYERHLHRGTQHGFNNDTTPRCDAEAARRAWERTIGVFNSAVRTAGWRTP
jgi:carboxymethylenebutenolidase